MQCAAFGEIAVFADCDGCACGGRSGRIGRWAEVAAEDGVGLEDYAAGEDYVRGSFEAGFAGDDVAGVLWG